MALEAVDLRGSKGTGALALGVVFLILATVAVALRFSSRRMMKVSLGKDDYMIGVALILAYGCIVCNIIGVVYGGIGIHVQHVQPAQVTVFFKNLIPTILLWASACTAVKTSLLLLYIRVFSSKRFRRMAYVVMTIVGFWWLSVFLEEFLLCRPFAFNWDQSIRGGVCADNEKAYLIAGLINLCTDLIVLCFPVPMVLRLHLPLRNRLALLVTFGVGFFVCIVTAIRISAILQFSFADPTYTMWHTIVWSQLEPTLGIVCACVPLMRPIFAKVFPHAQRSNTKESNPANGSAHGRHTFSGSDDHTYPLTEFGNQAFIEADTPKSHGNNVQSSVGDDLQDNAIRVKNGWDMQSVDVERKEHAYHVV